MCQAPPSPAEETVGSGVYAVVRLLQGGEDARHMLQKQLAGTG
jgi:hypothetical protein